MCAVRPGNDRTTQKDLRSLSKPVIVGLYINLIIYPETK